MAKKGTNFFNRIKISLSIDNSKENEIQWSVIFWDNM